MLRVDKVAIVGATGATGVHLAGELRRRGVAVRAISRSSTRLAHAFAGLDVDTAVADAVDEASTREAVAGCDVIVDCIGLPAELMSNHAVTARNLVAAAAATGARLVQVSSFWAFLPIHKLPLTEDHPREGGNAYVLARRAAEDIMIAGGAAVIHLPDFFGPHVGASSHQGPLEDAAAGRPMSWIGGADTVREAVFVPDAMHNLAELMRHEEAYGRSLVFPGSGPVTARRLAEIAGRHLGRAVNVRAAGPTMLKLVALFSKDLRAFLPMVPYYLGEIRYDASRLAALLGHLRVTPYEEAVPATLDWIRGRKG